MNQQGQKVTRRGGNAIPPRQAYTVREFCESYRVSRTHLYALWARGDGPRQFRAGAKVLISCEAAREWADRETVAA